MFFFLAGQGVIMKGLTKVPVYFAPSPGDHGVRSHCGHSKLLSAHF